MSDFKEAVFEYVKTIPYGQVATYGQVAKAIGKPRATRAVGNVLHTNKDVKEVPCYRVVNSQGHLACHYGLGGLDGQKKFLEAEGVKVINYQVDLSLYGIRMF